MEKFTFGVLAYNVEKYIIECLESIKYQIENFGTGYEITLIVAEDCSTDRTLELIKNWTNLNSNLFLEGGVEIHENLTNQGLVKNIIGLYKNIKTRNFKVIDGDDILYKNNIFELMGDYDVVLTQTVHFQENRVITRGINYYFYRILLNKNPGPFLNEIYRHFHTFDTPGIFFTSKFLDQQLYDAMDGYKMLDDIPRWRHIFSRNDLTVKAVSKPYVLYRVGSGVSTNSFHEKRSDLDIDVERINKTFVKESYIEDRYRTLRQSIFKKLVRYWYRYHSPVIMDFEMFHKNAVSGNEGNDFLAHIISKSNHFMDLMKTVISDNSKS